MRRRRYRRRNPSGFWSWASEHWFLTFLLASSAIGVPVALLRSARASGSPSFGQNTLAAGLKPGDVVMVNADKNQVPGFGMSSVCVRVTALTSGSTFQAALVDSPANAFPVLPQFVGTIGNYTAADVIALKCGA